MKYLQEEDTAWKNEKHYLNAVKKLSDPLHSIIWRNKYAARKSIGSCMFLHDKFNPQSFEEFYRLYIKSGYDEQNICKDKKYRGRTYEELEEIAFKWKTECGDTKNPIQLFYDAIIGHALVETSIGSIFERQITQLLSSKGFEVKHGEDKEDALMAIDLKVYKGSILRYLFQIKPLSFFISQRNDVLLDRLNTFSKNQKAHDLYKDAPLLYIVYDKNTLNLLKNPRNKRIIWKYEELVALDGRPLIKSSEVTKEELSMDELMKNKLIDK